jgi:Mg-chelatase subunit ChlD
MTTHICFVLDRSGSMSTIADDVVGGFNTFLADQQADGNDAVMTLVQFDTQDPFEVVADAVPIAEMVPLTGATFVPRAGTPLFDALGRAIAHVSARQAKLAELHVAQDDVLVVAFTDGEENSSQELTRAQLFALIKDREAAGWTFAYMGANQDAYAEAGDMGLDPGRAANWAADAQGAQTAFLTLSAATKHKRERDRRGEKDPDDFFGS